LNSAREITLAAPAAFVILALLITDLFSMAHGPLISVPQPAKASRLGGFFVSLVYV
jgi:hypothetical protein